MENCFWKKINGVRLMQNLLKENNKGLRKWIETLLSQSAMPFRCVCAWVGVGDLTWLWSKWGQGVDAWERQKYTLSISRPITEHTNSRSLYLLIALPLSVTSAFYCFTVTPLVFLWQFMALTALCIPSPLSFLVCMDRCLSGKGWLEANHR